MSEPTICLVMPYFGRWPEWMPLFLYSCGKNPSIDWLFFTDCGRPDGSPDNVRFVEMSWPECSEMIKATCGTFRQPRIPYKLCDFKFAYGHVFEDHLDGYDFWGFGDIDVIYGDLRNFLTPDLLEHDLLSFHENMISGHFTLIRNAAGFNRLYRQNPKWMRKAERRSPQWLDEHAGTYGIENVYQSESFSTPLSPYRPWTNGENRFPSQWIYRDGKLTNNLDGGREFMYLHFMRYVRHWRKRQRFNWGNGPSGPVVHFDPDEGKKAWTLSLDGFHQLPADETPEMDAGYIRSRLVWWHFYRLELASG